MRVKNNNGSGVDILGPKLVVSTLAGGEGWGDGWWVGVGGKGRCKLHVTC